MRSTGKYHSKQLFDFLRRILFLFLIVIITVTSGVRIIFNQFDLKYNLCEIYGEKDPKEEEIIVDDLEDEDREFYFKQYLPSIYFYTCFTEFITDIQLPPPKKV